MPASVPAIAKEKAKHPPVQGKPRCLHQNAASKIGNDYVPGALGLLRIAQALLAPPKPFTEKSNVP